MRRRDKFAGPPRTRGETWVVRGATALALTVILGLGLLTLGCQGYRTTQMAAGADHAPALFFEFDTGKLEVRVPSKDGDFVVGWHGVHAGLYLPVVFEPVWDAPAVYTLGPPAPD